MNRDYAHTLWRVSDYCGSSPKGESSWFLSMAESWSTAMNIPNGFGEFNLVLMLLPTPSEQNSELDRRASYVRI